MFPIHASDIIITNFSEKFIAERPAKIWLKCFASVKKRYQNYPLSYSFQGRATEEDGFSYCELTSFAKLP